MWSIPGANGQDDGHDMRPQPSQQEQGSPKDLFVGRACSSGVALPTWPDTDPLLPHLWVKVKHKVVTGPPAQGCVEAGGQSGT